jgi:threonine dehydratase
MGEYRLLQPDDFERARRRIGDRVHRTPLISCRTLGARVGTDLQFKAELFQKTGSFKIRGVFNLVLALSAKERARGLVSISAGNHAAALAYAASTVGTTATIVMPSTAVASKISATRAYGGEVILTDADLLQTCRQIENERGLLFVHPFDDLRIMAGHGTLGLEVAEDLTDPALMIVPVGGGGLIGGAATAMKLLRPGVRVVGVEPEGADAMTRSLAQDRPIHLDTLDTIADGLAAPFVGSHNLAHVREFVDEVVSVSDRQIREATRALLFHAKLAVEPSAAAGLAALLSGAVQPPTDGSVCCVLSGGNLDRDVLSRII